MSIHKTAIIDPSAELADDVEVQAYSIIEANVRIGAGSVIGPHCVIGAGTIMGEKNRTYSGAQVGVAPQDLKHIEGAQGRTEIGDGNIFREFVTISSSTVYKNDTEEKVTRIGSNCLFMATAHVGHDCIVGDRLIMANGSALSGHVTVQDRVNIGGIVGVHQFCVLGQMSFIGGMARINKDVPPYMLVEGHPARCFGPNRVGLERNGLTPEAIKEIRKVYKVLYRSGLNTTQALARITEEIAPSPEREVLVDFVKASKRGICK
jgi:UDP-N-acetylglucosamine acyltransferase